MNAECRMPNAELGRPSGLAAFWRVLPARVERAAGLRRDRWETETRSARRAVVGAILDDESAATLRAAAGWWQRAAFAAAGVALVLALLGGGQ